MTDTHTTAHIPDEAVTQAAKLAAVKAYTEVEGKCRPVAMTAALTAALPHLSALCAVEVMKLEWDNASDSEAYLVSAAMVYDLGMLRYCILNNPDPDVNEYTAQGLKINSTIFHQHGFKTIEAAKAAAQADFERRILACVVTKPVDASGSTGLGLGGEAPLIELLHDLRFRLENIPSGSPKDDEDLVRRIIAEVSAIRALSAEPAPAADMKEKCDRYEQALEKISEEFELTTSRIRLRDIARAALNVEARNG